MSANTIKASYLISQEEAVRHKSVSPYRLHGTRSLIKQNDGVVAAPVWKSCRLHIFFFFFFLIINRQQLLYIRNRKHSKISQRDRKLELWLNTLYRRKFMRGNNAGSGSTTTKKTWLSDQKARFNGKLLHTCLSFLPSFQFGTNTSVHRCIPAAGLPFRHPLLKCNSFARFLFLELTPAEDEGSVRMGRSRRVKREGVRRARFPLWHGALAFGTERHLHSTTAESRAMMATPLNMSRICRRDCLGRQKNGNKH